MHCTNCGFENETGTSFCANCGSALASPNEPPKPVKAKPRDSGKVEPINDESESDARSTARLDTASVPVAAAAVAADGATQVPEDQQILWQPPATVAAGGPMAQSAPAGTVPPPADLTWAGATPPTVGQVGDSPDGGQQAEPPPGSPALQAPAQTASTFVAGPGSESSYTSWLFPLIALVLGMAIGALLAYIFLPQEEIIFSDRPTAEPSATSASALVVMPIPFPAGRGGAIVPPGPDSQVQIDLRGALIAENRIYLDTGKYTDDVEVLSKAAPEIAWEAALTPSRQGVVAVALCGSPDPATPVVLQGIGATGKTYAILDQSTGPAAGVYYAMSSAALSCPNSIPPASPWQRGVQGWGLSAQSASPTPLPTQRDDRNDQTIPIAPSPTPTRIPTAFPTSTGSTGTGATPSFPPNN